MGICGKKGIKRAPTVHASIDTTEVTSRAIMAKISDHYDFSRVLGHGHFGVVREATRKGATNGKKFAIKSISKKTLGKSNVKSLKRELDVLLVLDHPNIIKLYDVYEDEKYVHMVTDICYGGDLFDKILNENSITEDQAS
jgi:calcium-dependent protein kinase